MRTEVCRTEAGNWLLTGCSGSIVDMFTDIIIIATYTQLKNREARRHEPLVVFVETGNKPKAPAKKGRDEDDD